MATEEFERRTTVRLSPRASTGPTPKTSSFDTNGASRRHAHVSIEKDQFVVRDKPISFEEKTYNKFKAEKGFFERVKNGMIWSTRGPVRSVICEPRM